MHFVEDHGMAITYFLSWPFYFLSDTFLFFYDYFWSFAIQIKFGCSRKETQSLFSTNIRLGRVYMSKNLSTERKRGYNQMSEPMEFENQGMQKEIKISVWSILIFLVRVSAVGAKHSRRTALGEISKNKPKSSFASIKPALKSSKTSAGRVNVFQVRIKFFKWAKQQFSFRTRNHSSQTHSVPLNHHLPNHPKEFSCQIWVSWILGRLILQIIFQTATWKIFLLFQNMLPRSTPIWGKLNLEHAQSQITCESKMILHLKWGQFSLIG